MPQMIEHAKEQDNIKSPQPSRRELIHVERQVFNLRANQLFSLDERVQGYTVHGDNFGTPAFAFETEPAIPGTDIDHALAAQISRESKAIEAPAQMFEGLKAGKNAAVWQVDRMITESRKNSAGELLNACFVFVIARSDP